MIDKKYPGREVLQTYEYGLELVVDPDRADPAVEFGHPNAWACNMRHALVFPDGTDVHRGPLWRVIRFARRRVAKTEEALAAIPLYVDGMLNGSSFRLDLPIRAKFLNGGRVLHAVYRVQTKHRHEVYGVLETQHGFHETWMPADVVETWWTPMLVDEPVDVFTLKNRSVLND